MESIGRNISRDLSKLVRILRFGNFQLGLLWQLTYHRKNVFKETGFTTSVTFWGLFLPPEAKSNMDFQTFHLTISKSKALFPISFGVRVDGNPHVGCFYFKTLTILRSPFSVESNCMHYVQSLTISNASIDQSRSLGRQTLPAQNRREQTLENIKQCHARRCFKCKKKGEGQPRGVSENGENEAGLVL